MILKDQNDILFDKNALLYNDGGRYYPKKKQLPSTLEKVKLGLGLFGIKSEKINCKSRMMKPVTFGSKRLK